MKSLVDGGIELSLDDVRNCKKITFIKERNPQLDVKTRTFI